MHQLFGSPRQSHHIALTTHCLNSQDNCYFTRASLGTQTLSYYGQLFGYPREWWECLVPDPRPIATHNVAQILFGSPDARNPSSSSQPSPSHQFIGSSIHLISAQCATLNPDTRCQKKMVAVPISLSVTYTLMQLKLQYHRILVII